MLPYIRREVSLLVLLQVPIEIDFIVSMSERKMNNGEEKKKRKEEKKVGRDRSSDPLDRFFLEGGTRSFTPLRWTFVHPPPPPPTPPGGFL